jgi:CO dehydrogenase maturation factor
MTITIAMAGKGGVGKTTISAMLIKYMIQSQPGSILAIDADPSSNLNMTLGVDIDWTVGDIREDMLQQVKASLTEGGAAMGGLPGGISKREYLEYKIQSALAEGARFDLIAMGYNEGAGCYCAVNHNLRQVIDALSRHYAYVVIDNEAGLEHLSRHTTRDVQHLLIVSDTSQRGLVTAQRITKLRSQLNVNIEKAGLIVNRVPGGQLTEQTHSFIETLGVPLLGVIPNDEQVAANDMSGQPLLEWSDDSPVYQAVKAIAETILSK